MIRTRVLGVASVIAALVVGSVAFASAGEEAKPTAMPAPASALSKQALQLRSKVPSFSRAPTSRDVPPLRGPIFSSVRPVDETQVRRVASGFGKAIFAAPSLEGGRLCFAAIEDRPNASWAANFCGLISTLREKGIVWSINVTGNPAAPDALIVWGITSPDVTRVTLQFDSGPGLAVSPSHDGVFVFDVADRGYPTAVAAYSAGGSLIDTELLPSLGNTPPAPRPKPKR